MAKNSCKNNFYVPTSNGRSESAKKWYLELICGKTHLLSVSLPPDPLVYSQEAFNFFSWTNIKSSILSRCLFARPILISKRRSFETIKWKIVSRSLRRSIILCDILERPIKMNPEISVVQFPYELDKFDPTEDATIEKLDQKWAEVSRQGQNLQLKTFSHNRNLFVSFKKSRPFCLFSSFPRCTNKYQFIKVQMIYLRLEPGAAEWKAQTNPLSYGFTPFVCIFVMQDLRHLLQKSRI